MCEFQDILCYRCGVTFSWLAKSSLREILILLFFLPENVLAFWNLRSNDELINDGNIYIFPSQVASPGGHPAHKMNARYQWPVHGGSEWLIDSRTSSPKSDIFFLFSRKGDGSFP